MKLGSSVYLPDGEANSFDRSGSGFSDNVLEFGADLLDRVQAWGVFGHKEKLVLRSNDLDI
jgi:hypothetical protein